MKSGLTKGGATSGRPPNEAGERGVLGRDSPRAKEAGRPSAANGARKGTTREVQEALTESETTSQCNGGEYRPLSGQETRAKSAHEEGAQSGLRYHGLYQSQRYFRAAVEDEGMGGAKREARLAASPSRPRQVTAFHVE